MVDSVAVFQPGFRVLDSTGTPVNNAKIKFREIGGGAAKTVYALATLAAPSSLGTIVRTRSDGFPVVSFASSTTTPIYVGSGAYHIEITDANDVAIFPALDNVVGAVNTSLFLTAADLSSLNLPVLTKTGNYTVVVGDKGKLIVCNATGGFFTVTLPSAVTMGDAWPIGIRNDGTANQVGILASQNIQTPFGTRTSFSLRPGETVWLLSDGATWKIWSYTPILQGTMGVIVIADRLSAPPVSPTAGARYILTSAPSGDWSSFAEHDIAEATGQGTWFKVTPTSDHGWLAYVQDEDAYYTFFGSAWIPRVASDTAAGFIELAVQSEMETATDVVRAVTPGRQHFHPAHPKCVGIVANGTTGAAGGFNYNLVSTSRSGTGTYVVTLTVGVDTNPVVNATIYGGGQRLCTNVVHDTATQFTITIIRADTGNATDSAFAFAIWGDMA